MSFYRITSVIVVAQLILAGCTGNLKPTSANVENVDFPVMNQTRVAELGDRLVGQGTITKIAGIKAMAGGSCSDFAGAGPVINSGEVFQEFLTGNNFTYCNNGVLRNAFGREFFMQRCLNEMPDSTFSYGMGMDCPMRFEKGRFVSVEAENFQRTIYYSGKSGNEVYLEYREFKNDMARPDYTHSLTFDLSESDTVGFRGLRLKILSATNTEIEYRVEKNFSDR